MKYLSVDVETTGLDLEKSQVIQVAAIVDDTENDDYYSLDPAILRELPYFVAYVKHERYSFEEYPATMPSHAKIMQILHKHHGEAILTQDDPALEIVCYASNLGSRFSSWLIRKGIVGKPFAAGKNFGSFDGDALNRVPNFNDWVKFHHRNLDPVSHFWIPEEDSELPTLTTCLERANIAQDYGVTHDAYDDALAVIALIRKIAIDKANSNAKAAV